MAETQSPTQKYLEDITRYQYANVTARLGSSEETAHFMKGSLETLVDSFGLDKDIISGLKAGTLASEEGIAAATNTYNKKYQDTLEKLSVSDFYGLRSPVIKGLLGDEKAEEAKAVFDKYSDQTIGSITKKYSQAQAKLKDKTGLFDEAQKEEAKKTVEKLQPIATIINYLEERNFYELMNKAMKPTYKDMLSEALKKA